MPRRKGANLKPGNASPAEYLLAVFGHLHRITKQRQRQHRPERAIHARWSFAHDALAKPVHPRLIRARGKIRLKKFGYDGNRLNLGVIRSGTWNQVQRANLGGSSHEQDPSNK
jgi:hypothetical protein